MVKYRIYKEDGSFDETLEIPKSGKFETIEFSFEETYEEKLQKAILIDFEYTQKIDALLMKHTQKWIRKNQVGEVYSIPQEKLDEADVLAIECNEKILALGITDFTYRKTIKGL